MKEAIMATLYHKYSSDTHPQHQFCPVGEDSWCSWQKAKATENLANYKHKPTLADDVFKAILSYLRKLER